MRFARYIPHAAVLGLVALILAAPGGASSALNAGRASFLERFDYVVLWVSSGALLVCALLVITPARKYRLGGPHARPEFGVVAWISMLFAAGMGAGLVFWGASEPIVHALNPPEGARFGADLVEAGSAEAQRRAMAVSLLHWALHPWAIYALGALGVAVFAFAHHRAEPDAGASPGANANPDDARLSPSAVAGPRAHSVLRYAIDWLALAAVIFGIVASLANGVLQMAAGVASFGVGQSDSDWLFITLLAALISAALVSAVSGLARGIRILSMINVGLGLAIMSFILIAGPTGSIAATAATAAGDYLSSLPRLAFDLGARDVWAKSWTLTYFLWWMAWIPFVGVFIARISYGRTLGAFVTATVLVPSIVTLIWFATFGGAAFDAQFAQGVDLGIADGGAQQASYRLLETLPFAALTKALTVMLVFFFLVTSADSAAFVLAMLARGGDPNPPVRERVFWGLMLGFLAAGALLSGDGTNATEAYAVAGSIPIVFMLVWFAARLVHHLAKRARHPEGLAGRKASR